MMNSKIIVIGASLFLGAATVVHALPMEVPSSGPLTFEIFDRNGDGSVSAEEFYAVRSERMAARTAQGRMLRGAANAPTYAEIDLDGDQRLSGAEFARHQSTHCGRGRR